MMRKSVLAAIVLLAVGGVWAWRSWAGDESRLSRELRELARQAGKNGPESALVSVRTANRLAESFVEGADWSVDGPFPLATGSRDELRASIFQVRAAAQGIRFTIDDLTTRVEADRRSARQTFTVRATVAAYGDRAEVVREVTVRWTRTSEGWKIVRLEATEGFKRIR